jgi:predicted solute-binding protein
VAAACPELRRHPCRSVAFARSQRFTSKPGRAPPQNRAQYLCYTIRSPKGANITTSLGKTTNLPKLRISIVKYLNTTPLVWGFTNGPLKGKYDLSFTVPSQCAEALRTNAADIAIIPVIEYQRIDDLVILPDLAIASKTRVRSLLLVSKVPLEKARNIALDSSSRSTQALTKILCQQKWKIAPEFLEMPPDLPSMLQRTDAALLIGDPALRLSLATESGTRRGEAGEQICSAASANLAAASMPATPTSASTHASTASQSSTAGANQSSQFAQTSPATTLDPDTTLHIYDVVEQWRRLTTLPAVLAVWAARRKVATPEVIDDFQSSRTYGLRRLTEISTQAAADLNLPANKLQRYLTENINYTLDEENLRGLTAFFQSAADQALVPQAKPIEIAGARREFQKDTNAYAKSR